MPLPSRDDLAKLPPKAIVAYAARCARRAEPVYISAMSDRPDLLEAVDAAIRQAEQFAEGSVIPQGSSIVDTADAAAYSAYSAGAADAADAAARAAHAAARAANAAMDAAHATSRASHAAAFAASFAAFAAADVANAAAFMQAASRDFRKLAELTQSGQDNSISLDPTGPLGPL